mgnify:CR=1 FL=1
MPAARKPPFRFQPPLRVLSNPQAPNRVVLGDCLTLTSQLADGSSVTSKCGAAEVAWPSWGMSAYDAVP